MPVEEDHRAVIAEMEITILEELSMISSSKMQGNKNHRVQIKQTKLLKNAVVYGANASGKSNLVMAFAFIKATLMEGLSVVSVNDFCRNKEENKNSSKKKTKNFYNFIIWLEINFNCYFFILKPEAVCRH